LIDLMSAFLPRTRGGLLTAIVIAVVLVAAAVQLANPHSYLSEAVNRVAETGSGPDAPLTDLTSIDQLRSAFNVDVGHPRLLLLFSPT
jgi:hypothetical protein